MAQLPDFIIFANRSFAFQSSKTHESDHGGLYPEEVNNSFYLSGLGESAKPGQSRVVQTPVLSKDFAPTVLDYAGFAEESKKTQGQSLRPLVEQEGEN